MIRLVAGRETVCMGLGVSLQAATDDWYVDAKNQITAWIFESRAKSGFREAQKQD